MLNNDYSWAEEALCFWAAVMMSVLAVTSLGLRYVMATILCWGPAEFGTGHYLYMHQVCYEKRKIDVSENPNEHQPTNTFHQWVPFFLGVAAILCLLPHALWRLTRGFLWIDTHRLTRVLADSHGQDTARRHVMLRDHALLVRAGLQGNRWMLTAAAAARKTVVVLVSLGQVLLAALVFKPQLAPRQETKHETEFNGSLPLPERFLCVFGIPMMSNIQTFSVWCTLPINQVYSKGFAFLFYLFLLLTVCCLLDTVQWACRLGVPGLRDSALRRYLAVTDPGLQQLPHSPPLVSRFLDSLGADGRLLLLLTDENCGSLAAADFANHLWQVFIEGQEPLPGNSAHSPSGLGPAHSPPVAVAAPPPFFDSRTEGVETPEQGGGGGGGAFAGDLDHIPLVEMSGKA